MKVWGGWIHHSHRFATTHNQVRVVIRARSRAAVVRALNSYGLRGITDGFIRDYWCPTGNAKELAAVAETEGVPFVTNGMRYNSEDFAAEPLEAK